jgi:DNA-binding GntR family transcriptional regulator
MEPVLELKQRRSLGQDVFEYLKQSIIDQTIEPGFRLVESRLAKKLGISRTPLREALHKLEREEWIKKAPSGGFQVVTLCKQDIEETFGIRIVLEVYAARLATQNYQDRDLLPLEKKLEEYRQCFKEKNSEKPETDSLHKLNTEFHDLLYALSSSPRLIRMINQLNAQIARFRQMILAQEEFARKSYEDHIRMLDAIKKRDENEVESLVRNHLIKGRDAVLKQFPEEEREKKSA